MGKILKLDVGWDDKLPEEICAEMKTVSRDVDMLSELIFQDKLSMSKSHMDFTYSIL